MLRRMVNKEYGCHLHGGQEGVFARTRGVGIRLPLPPALVVAILGPLGLSLSCSPTGEAPPPPPQALSDLVLPTSVQATQSVPGLVYYGLRNEEEPWSIHLLRVELDRCELGFRVLEAPVPGGEGVGRSRVSELVAAAREDVLAAVNGDFFSPEGLPAGPEIVAGQVRRVLDRPAFAWHPRWKPWFGLPELEGDSVGLGWQLPRSKGDGETEVIGGFPLLLLEGRRVGDLEVSERPGFSAERHPRTAVGMDPERNLLWIVVVDGRQPNHSAGMTLPELTSLFEALEVEEAINLDGGGSSVMVLDGSAVSSPSDSEGERLVANALGVRLAPELCRLRR